MREMELLDARATAKKIIFAGWIEANDVEELACMIAALLTFQIAEVFHPLDTFLLILINY
jgi:hypothetical protein